MSAAMAAEFLEDVLQFQDWTVDDYILAEALAYYIKIDAASYDSQKMIASVSLGKMLSLVASGAATADDNALLYCSQLQDHTRRAILLPQGIRMVVTIKGTDKYIDEPIGVFDFPSVEEILATEEAK